MENDVVANLAAVIDAGVGIDDAVAAQLCPVHDGCVGINLATVAQLHAVADIGECADIDFLSDGGLGRDEGERVDALFLRFHALVELQQPGHAVACVFYPYKRGLHVFFQLDILVNKHDGRLRLI